MAARRNSLAEMRAAFINAIREAPCDDAPRLIYADWLEENADPARAEFIRLQCEESQRFAVDGIWLDGKRRPRWYVNDPAYKLMGNVAFSGKRCRQEQLWAEHGRQWLNRSVPRLFKLTKMRRGFPFIRFDYHADARTVAESCDRTAFGEDWFIAIVVKPNLPPSNLTTLLSLRNITEITIVDGPTLDLRAEAFRIADAIMQCPFYKRLESLRVPDGPYGRMVDRISPEDEVID